jgi:hypothetical protein
MPNPRQSRGYRNKNPGNIDFNPANKWQGQVGKEPGPRGRFAVFEEHRWGIRALAVLLITYFDRHGCNTVAKVIDRWAPPSENDTAAYQRAVAKALGVTPNARIDLHSWDHLRPMVQAIITHELGGNPYSAAEIDAGVRLAGVVPAGAARAAAAVRDRSNQAAAAGGIAAGAAGAVAAAAEAAPALSALQALDWRVALAVVAAAAIGLAVFLLLRRRPA